MRFQYGWMSVGLLCGAVAILGCAQAIAQGDRASNPPSAAPLALTSPQDAVDAIPFDYFDGLAFDDAVPTPKSVLGHDIGERFTRHADVVRYLESVAAASDRVIMRQYGWTHERRSLHYLVITSPENHAQLDEILDRNRELTDPRGVSESQARRIIRANPAVVWFSYNVHGNEASCSETAMQVVYTMAAANNEEVRDILDNVVLVVDPMINPDGRDRYVNWYNMVLGAGRGANSDRNAAEHNEPWPGGRTNHYYFDLNRDWLWLVHPESRSRLAIYKRFMPQLHIDYHEQGYRSPYFFGAGAEPYNTNIPDQTREWIEMYGEANAKVFDEHGLVYATRERFDYLYPGYGKVLPVYHGAVGLLTEQAGHGFAGLAVDVWGDYVLTLRERARNHFLTSMSYLETTAAHRAGQLERFRQFFVESMDVPAGGPAAFFVHADNDPALLKKIWTLCDTHGIEIETLDADADIPGLRSYRTGDEVDSTRLPRGSWVIRADQPMGRLARAIFERETEVTDIDTYDITSWTLPISFGVEASFTNIPLRAATSPLTTFSPPRAHVTGEGNVALIVDARQHHFPVAVGAAVERDLHVRRAGGDITTSDGRSFPRGSLIVHTIRNASGQIESFIQACLNAGVSVHRVSSGMTTAGHVLGANDNWMLTLPRVALVRGEPMSSNSFGQHWHLLDIESPFPHTVVNADRLARSDLSAYNVIVLPSMFGSLDELTKRALDEWTRDGGALVATGGAASWASRELLGLTLDDEDDNEQEKLSDLTWEERRQRGVKNRIPGAMLRAEIDTTHPLAAGMRDWIGVIKRGSRRLPVADNGSVIARFDAEPRIAGAISDENADTIGGTPFMTHHRLGRGGIVCFSDDVTFRGFHHAGMRLLMNAIIFGP